MTLRLKAADETTTLFDFDTTTGSGNPGTLITNLGVGFDVGTVAPETTVSRSRRTARVVARDLPPVEMFIPLMCSASSYTNLRTGLGTLAGYLEDPPGPLEWVEGGVTYLIDLLGTLELPALIRGQGQGGLISTRLNSLGPVPIRLLRQWGMRGAAVSVAGVTVPNDPTTSTKGRVYVVSGVTGDLPTVGKLRVQMDTGSAVRSVHVASRALRSQASTVFSDWLAETGWLQLDASGRGWTIALGTGTTSAADASASGGNVARVNGSQAAPLRRITATRTTLMDSIRGTWDVWLRGMELASADVWKVQLGYGPSTSEPVPVTFDPVTVDGSDATAFGYIEKRIGQISIPTDAALSGLRLEVTAWRDSGSGTTLDLGDFIWFTPAATAATVRIGSTANDDWLPSELVTPPAVVASDPTWIDAGAVVNGKRVLDAVNESVGTNPNTGQVWGVGRHTISFSFAGGNHLTGVVACRVVNITGNTEVLRVEQALSAQAPEDKVLAFTGTAGQAYQAQVNILSTSSGSVGVQGISRDSIAVLGNNESIRTDPNRGVVDRLDASGNLTENLTVDGAVPVALWPGANHIFIRVDDIALTGYTEGQNVLGRTPTASVIYSPRYAL